MLCRSSSLVEKDASKEKSTRTEIRLRSKEREPLRPLSRAEDSRRHSRENTNMQRDISVHTGRASSYSSSVGSDNHRRVSHESDYDRLRDQCMNAMSELETLKRQHAEIIGRCDFAVQEADYFRKQHKAVVIKCDQLVREAQALRSQFEHLQQEKQKLQQDYEEIVLLRELEKVEKLETSGSSGKNASGGGASKAEDHSDDVELLKKQNMDLTEELEDFKADYALVTSKLSKSEEETAKLREQYNALVSERDTLIIERNALKQQCTAAIRGYDKALREKDETAKSAVHAKQQRDLALRECDQVMALRIKDSKDITKLKDERNAAINEYKLIMSERDSVHKEIEKLQEDIDVVKTENKSLKDDKERIQHEAECLRQEIRSVLADRDQVVKESHDLRERLHGALKDRETTMKKMEEMRQDLEMLKQERNAARKERSEAIVHRDKILRECFEVKQMFQSVESGETEQGEEFKKQFEGLSKELTKAWKEAEVAMMRRDWAFSERDKIVRELERIRAINTDLVEERDCLMDELRRSRSEGEVLKRQNSTFLKEIHLTSKHREGGLTPEERAQLIASADSAIDTESCVSTVNIFILQGHFQSAENHRIFPSFFRT